MQFMKKSKKSEFFNASTIEFCNELIFNERKSIEKGSTVI